MFSPLGNGRYWKWGDAFSPYFLLALFPWVLGSLAVKLNLLRGNYSLWAVRYTSDLCRHISVIHDPRTCITFHCSCLQASVGDNLGGSNHSKLTGREISPQEGDKGISSGTLARTLDKLRSQAKERCLLSARSCPLYPSVLFRPVCWTIQRQVPWLAFSVPKVLPLLYPIPAESTVSRDSFPAPEE